MSEGRRFLTIPSLDGLRAVSIGLVFAGHVGFDLTPGGFGVTVFFVLFVVAFIGVTVTAQPDT